MNKNGKRKRVGVLGGTRFIGYHLISALHNYGHDITIFNRGVTRSPCPLPSAIKLVYGDRNNPYDLQPFFKNEFDAVIDLSGYLLRQVEPIALKYKSYVKHYIFCSTSSVYSLPLPLKLKESTPRTEASNTYGGNKAQIENFLFKMYNSTKCPITILRPHGVFGPYDAYQLSYIFYRLHNFIPIVLVNKHDVKINFLYIKDLINAFLLAMNNPASYGKAYNVAGNDAVSKKDFIELCGEICKCKPKLYFMDKDEYSGVNVGVYWPEHNLVSDNAKIKQDLKLKFTPLKTALIETYEWLAKRPKQKRCGLLLEERFILKNRHIPEWVKRYRKSINWVATKLSLLKLYVRLIFTFSLLNKMKAKLKIN